MSATTRAPAGVAIATAGTLPFFGFPLWAFATGALALLVGGFVLRRVLRED